MRLYKFHDRSPDRQVVCKNQKGKTRAADRAGSYCVRRAGTAHARAPAAAIRNYARGNKPAADSHSPRRAVSSEPAVTPYLRSTFPVAKPRSIVSGVTTDDFVEVAFLPLRETNDNDETAERREGDARRPSRQSAKGSPLYISRASATLP